MTTPRHFLTTDVLKRQPWVVVALLTVAHERARGRPGPAWAVRGDRLPLPEHGSLSFVAKRRKKKPASIDAEATSRQVQERLADGAVALCAPGGEPALVVVHEVQTFADPTKHWRLPDYAVGFRSRYECPVEVVVVCFDEKTATALAKPIRLGLGTSHFTPLVVTPADFPVKLPAEVPTADRLLLATLAYAGHPDDEELRAMVRATYAELRRTHHAGTGEAGLYAEFIKSVVQGEALKRLEEDMRVMERIEFESEIGRRAQAEGRAEGEVKGIAASVLLVLEAGGVPVSAAQRERILACTDRATLTRWLSRARTATSVDELFA